MAVFIRVEIGVKETFEGPFDKNGFTEFIKNLLNRIEDSPFTYQGNYIPDAYKQYIKTLERIGKFGDGENSIDILVITLQKETSLERARTMQRNFIAWYLNGSRGGELKDAALAVFVSPDKEDWRFSLVKMDYKFEETKSGRMKVKEEFTPARRWSFLVGKNEKSHTAQTRLVNILKNDEQDPTLEEIEQAFDIETVTKEFFLEYRGLFLHTKDELDRVVMKDPKIEEDFEAKGVDTVNFAKKLLGQIVFLYFLQKKGWFGVGRDYEWGTGSKHFLRELFDKKHADYDNFFNDILEPLFYDALSRDRSDIDHWNDQFKCKIPFLNGGLFDPIGNYNWTCTDIIIPDKLFSNNIKTKECDKGTGILDVFDRYNFTVKEDEPLEKEVAIDPELLGKAYEKFNAIRPDNYAEFKKALKSGKRGDENKFNKKFGVYYTPREIVHYMCQQSLINYLHTELITPNPDRVSNPVRVKISKDDIESLIHLGEQVSENEATTLLKEKLIAEGKQKTTKNKPVLPESIKNNAALIDNKLAEITVCDPAVGSGAFPVGMMSEIVKARNVLSVFLNDKNPSACNAQAGSLSPKTLTGFEPLSGLRSDTQRTIYDFKRRCIEHSLYGVDIDPGAVEIAK
ncbi:MAG: class I SAM-dependent DNA methyltransferase, partial [Nitrospinota bacterium]